MVLFTCEALVRHALLTLDSAGEGSSPAACHLQAALDALNPPGEDIDIELLANAFFGATEREVRTFIIE